MTFFRASLSAPTSSKRTLNSNAPTMVLEGAGRPQAIAKIHIANTHTSAVTATLDIFDGSVAHVLFQGVSIAAGDFLEIRDEQLGVDQSLRVTSGNTNGHLHVSVFHSNPWAGG